MDSSPEPSKPIATESVLSEPVEIQESPVFTYISNLSPIKPDKSAPAPQSFPGLNSPPLVFTSPRVNPLSQSTFLERPQFAQLSGAGLSGRGGNFKDVPTVADKSEVSYTQVTTMLITCPRKAFLNNNSPTENAISPSTCADDFFTGGANMDGSSTDSFSANLAAENSNDIPQSMNGLTGKEYIVKIDEKDDAGKNEMEVGKSSAISEQAEGDHQVKSLSGPEPAEENDMPGDGDVPSAHCPKVDPNSSIDHALINEHSGHSANQNAGSGRVVEEGSSSQLESPKIVHEQGSCSENIDMLCTEVVENQMQQNPIPKVGQHQCGIRRRCLQFEDGQGKEIVNNIGSQNASANVGFPSLPASTEDPKVLESTSLDKPVIPNAGLVANVAQPSFSPTHSENFNTRVTRPSGIGLHLNSIVNAMHMGSGAIVSVKSAERGCLSLQGKRTMSTMSCHLSKKCSISLSPVEGVSLSNEDNRHDSHSSIAVNAVTSLTPYSIRPLNDSWFLSSVEQQPNLCNMRKSDSENAEDFSPSSPKKRRKKGLDSGEGYGCKRCNCKKTKCLKLYCDCFAAGIYCAEPCACQGCFNRPDYEDTVLETRQQIESRNPLAFAPKIIQHVSEPPGSISVEDGNHFTPASARHKRGCNCKKSKCLKKYCECYQANVGCSDGCRCEGCENINGRKEEYCIIKEIGKQKPNEMLDSFHTKLEQVESRDGLLHDDLCNLQNLTPPTPSFQCSNHGKSASKSWFSSRRYLPSPEDGLPIMAPYEVSPGPATNPDTHDMVTGANNEIMDLVSFDQESDYGTGGATNQFSPRCDGPRHMGNPNAVPNPQNWVSAMRPQTFPGNRQVSSASALRWRSSPITPMTHFSGAKLLEVVDFDGGFYNLTDDETPEILKETPTPPSAVKVSSPNKKRVSPPHGHRTELGASSSGGLRTGRKFILQAVPSFPPLTPCFDSKTGAGQSIDDSETVVAANERNF